MIKSKASLFDKSGKPIPVTDTVSENLPGEKWKDIPDFEGLYKLSNYGRVKSLSRYVYRENGTEAFRPGRILKLAINEHIRNNKPEVHIQMRLSKDGTKYMFSVPRHVYFLFVDRFFLNDHSVIIRRKDNNILNCYYKNLYLSSLSEVAREGFASNTRKSIFQDQVKPVSQYTLEGKYITTYKCARDAANAVGVPPNYISDAANKKARPTADSYWRYGKSKENINVSKLKQRLQNALRSKRKKVQQFTLSGQLLKTYDTVSEAAKAMKAKSCSNISYACMGKYHSSKGFIWKYVD